MQAKGEFYISRRYTREDYYDCHMDSLNDQNWEKAMEIFDDRIRGRYLKPIHTLMHDPNCNGFTIMAIACLLVETLYQFREGIDVTRHVGDSYVRFLTEEFDYFYNNEELAHHFYTDIRCGILHSGQTKNDAYLTVDHNQCFMENGHIVVSVRGFIRCLEDYYHKYRYRILRGNTCRADRLRQNFIRKMDYICDGNRNA